MAGTLAGRSNEIDSLVMNFKMVSERLASVSAKADSAMDGICNVADDLGGININDLATALQKLVDSLNSTDGSIGKLVNDDEMYDSLDSLVKDINRLVNKIENNPKKYIRIKVF